jgi:hypothetical protein
VTFASMLGLGAIDPNPVSVVNPDSGGAADVDVIMGAEWGVETWLSKVDESARSGTGRAIDVSLHALHHVPPPPRASWALESGPSQAVLTAASIAWTSDVEAALKARADTHRGDYGAVSMLSRRQVPYACLHATACA